MLESRVLFISCPSHLLALHPFESDSNFLSFKYSTYKTEAKLNSGVIVGIKSSKKRECFHLSTQPVVISHKRPVTFHFHEPGSIPIPRYPGKESGCEALMRHSQHPFSTLLCEAGWAWGSGHISVCSAPWRAVPIGGARGSGLQGNGGRRDLLPSLGLLFLPASIHLSVSTSSQQPAVDSRLQHLENFQKQPYCAPRRYEHQ